MSPLLQLARNFLRRRLHPLGSEPRPSDGSCGVFGPGKFPSRSRCRHSCARSIVRFQPPGTSSSPNRLLKLPGQPSGFWTPSPHVKALLLANFSSPPPPSFGAPAAVFQREAAAGRFNGAVAGGPPRQQSGRSGPRTAPQAPPRPLAAVQPHFPAPLASSPSGVCAFRSHLPTVQWWL